MVKCLDHIELHAGTCCAHEPVCVPQIFTTDKVTQNFWFSKHVANPWGSHSKLQRLYRQAIDLRVRIVRVIKPYVHHLILFMRKLIVIWRWYTLWTRQSTIELSIIFELQLQSNSSMNFIKLVPYSVSLCRYLRGFTPGEHTHLVWYQQAWLCQCET